MLSSFKRRETDALTSMCHLQKRLSITTPWLTLLEDYVQVLTPNKKNGNKVGSLCPIITEVQWILQPFVSSHKDSDTEEATVKNQEKVELCYKPLYKQQCREIWWHRNAFCQYSRCDSTHKVKHVTQSLSSPFNISDCIHLKTGCVHLSMWQLVMHQLCAFCHWSSICLHGE